MSAESPKVISIKGGEIVPPGTPIRSVIDELERALEMAKSGDIDGIAVIYSHYDNCTSSMRAGRQTRSMIGLLEILKLQMIKED